MINTLNKNADGQKLEMCLLFLPYKSHKEINYLWAFLVSYLEQNSESGRKIGQWLKIFKNDNTTYFERDWKIRLINI